VKLAISKNATRAIIGLAILGFALSIIVHLESVFLTGAYQKYYGEILFDVGILLFVFPPLYELYRSRELLNNIISNITEKDFPKLTILVFKIGIFYFSVLFVIVLMNIFYEKTDNYIHNLFWSFGNVVLFLSIIFYNQTMLNVRRS